MSASNAPESSPGTENLAVQLELDAFGREMLKQQCAELGVSEQELVRFAVLYYLADLDSDRISRRIPQAPVVSGDP
jgi:hypothetical protein